MPAGPFGAPFRLAGMTYLQFIGVSSRAVRNCVKEPLRKKVLNRETMFFNKSVDGVTKVGHTSYLPASKTF